MNALVEAEVIQALYRASQAGVPIDLIVRGVCALRPGVPGISETIRVRSLVGRFLEHARVCWFENDGESQLFCSSADWMNRNLHQRVETCFPILDAELSARVLQESLDLQLRDNTQAWLMQAGGSYKKVSPMPSEEPVNAQSALLEILTGNNPTGTPTQAIPKRFRRRGKM
jgi:polyphosphate kinase